MPKLPEFHLRDARRADYGGADTRSGFSLDFWFRLESKTEGQVLLDNRDVSGRGLQVATTASGAVRISLNDGRSESSWECDASAIRAGKVQHMVITVDGGPKIMTFVVDGVLCDGGLERQFGWGRFSPTLRTPNGSPAVKIGAALRSLRVYQRALRTSEAVGNFRAGL